MTSTREFWGVNSSTPNVFCVVKKCPDPICSQLGSLMYMAKLSCDFGSPHLWGSRICSSLFQVFFLPRAFLNIQRHFVTINMSIHNIQKDFTGSFTELFLIWFSHLDLPPNQFDSQEFCEIFFPLYFLFATYLTFCSYVPAYCCIDWLSLVYFFCTGFWKL